MKSFVWMLGIALLMMSCTATKTQYLHQFDGFMEEVQEEHKAYSSDDWEEKNEELKFLLEEEYPQFEEEFTDEEKVKIWSQTFTYEVMQHKEMVIEEITENQDMYIEMMKENAKFVETVGNELTNEFLPEIEKALPEFEKAARSFVKDLENSGALDRIKEAAEELGEKMKEIEENHKN
ncbi:MAG: DUF6565 domain-containing protein [Bacteroidota bacterium]